MGVKQVKPEIVYLHGDAIVPAKSFAYKINPATGEAEPKKPRTHVFENTLKSDLTHELEGVDLFPTRESVFVSITHGFHSKRKFGECDLDNRAKTILDALEGPVYHDDSQVRMLWTDKILLEDKEESYYRISIKLLDDVVEKIITSRIEEII